MKHVLICLCLLWALPGCKPGVDKDDAKPAADKKDAAEFEVQRDAAGETIVSLSPDTQKRIDLKVAEITAAERQPEWIAYGTVLDPASLVMARGEMDLDEATLAAAQKVTQRAKTLAQDENVSRKTLEAAEADERAAEIKLHSAARGLALEWGDGIASLQGSDRSNLMQRLADHQTALLQVELPLGESLSGKPESIRASLAGRDGDFAATMVSAAPKADPKSLGQGFLLRVEDAGPTMAPGAAVTARLRLPGAAQKGALIPEASVVRAVGKTWVYLVEADNKFRRREVSLEAPMDQGWFATNGIAVGDKVVVQAAQLLLSEEQKAAIQGD